MRWRLLTQGPAGWVPRLDELGIAHSGVEDLDYTSSSMVTFRDPDGIQLEFFWRAPA